MLSSFADCRRVALGSHDRVRVFATKKGKTMTDTNTSKVDDMRVRETAHHELRKTWLDFRLVNCRLTAEYKDGEDITFSVVAFVDGGRPSPEAAFSATLGTHSPEAWTDTLVEASERWVSGIFREQTDPGGWTFTVGNGNTHVWVPDAIFDQMLDFASSMAGRDAAMAAHPAGKGRV